MYSSLITIEYEHLLPSYLAVRLYYFCSFMMISKGRRDVNTEMCHLSPLSVKAFLPQWLRGQPFRAIYPFRACLSCREPLCPRSQPSKGSHIQWLIQVMYKYLAISAWLERTLKAYASSRLPRGVAKACSTARLLFLSILTPFPPFPQVFLLKALPNKHPARLTLF